MPPMQLMVKSPTTESSQVDEPLVVKLCLLRHLSPPVAGVACVKKNKHEGDLRHQG
jgi:hypothetical protein